MKRIGVLVSGLLLGLAGCAEQPLGDGLPDSVDCSSCHGGPDSIAPPRAIGGGTETTLRGVGAHAAHLSDGALRPALACTECHRLPERVEDPGHVDALPAEVIFGELARESGLEPTWNPDQETCSATWCHGGRLSGGSNTTPTWTRVGQGETRCGSCHSLPPPAPHPQTDRCFACHPTTVDAGRSIVPGGTHLNGVLNAISNSCSGCHGSEANAAPPVSVGGAVDPSDPAVGAHQAHLVDGNLRLAIACEECHLVPAAVDDPGHLDDSPAELVWGALATAGDLEPVWDRDAVTCQSTWCHGAGLSGGSNTAPIWTLVDGSQTACGTCHGAPPPAPHPQSARCQDCHPGTVGQDGTIRVADGLHLNGQVEALELNCRACHGSDVNPAPPVSLAGETETSALGVGAHQRHLADGALRRAIACEECHQVPAAVDAAGHLDEAPADLTWGPLASAGDLAPIWDRQAATCAATWCHGAGLSGGSNTTPIWTQVDGSQTACGTCHGVPPPPPHPAAGACRDCHAASIDPDGSIRPDGAHLNGVIEAIDLNDCSACHGSQDNPAPPRALSGSSDPADLAVGAHQSHLRDGSVRQAIACGECHQVPGSVEDAGHLDASPAEVIFGSLASLGDLQPAWDRDAGTCSNTYCHGASLAGGMVPTPRWTELDGSQARCWSCHGLPPPAPHPQSIQCQGCHPETTTAPLTIDVAGGKHIDGTVQYDLSAAPCGTCHAVPPSSGSHAIHYGLATLPAAYGDASNQSTADAYGFGCGNCHPIDPAHHGNGQQAPGGGLAEIDLDPAGAPPGSLRALNPPGASYTPGGTVLNDGGYDYTEGSCANVYCHSRLDVLGSDPVPVPGTDFTPTGYPLIYPDFNIDTARTYQAVAWGGATLGCADCHGFPPRTFYPEVEAGVGDSHSWIDEAGYEDLHGYSHGYAPTACATCHHQTVTDPGVRSYDGTSGWSIYEAVPIAGHGAHVNGQADVAFTPDPVTLSSDHDLSAAGYDPATRTCSQVSCHLQETETVWGAPYRWQNFWECNRCHQY